MSFAAKDVLYISVYPLKATEGDNNNAEDDIDTFGDQRNEIQLCVHMFVCVCDIYLYNEINIKLHFVAALKLRFYIVILSTSVCLYN